MPTHTRAVAHQGMFTRKSITSIKLLITSHKYYNPTGREKSRLNYFYREGRWDLSDLEVTRLEEQVKTLFAGQARIEKSLEDFKTDIYKEIKELKEQFANRLPLWTTALISLLTAAVVWFAK